MDNLVSSLQSITDYIVNQIDSVTEQQILFFIEQREAIVEQLRNLEITVAEQELYGAAVIKVLEYDPMITAKLEQLRDEAKNNIQKSSVARVQNAGYNTTYPNSNSYYFDSQK